MELTHSDELKEAVAILENPSFIARMSDKFSEAVIKPGFELAPDSLRSKLLQLSDVAINKALGIAIGSLDKEKHGAPSISNHKLAVGVSGAIGGFFGMLALTMELPITTVLMLRSIADIADSQGEDISTREAQLQCVSVFSLGGGSEKIDDAETVYFAGRIALAKTLGDAASYLAGKKVIDKSSPVLLKFISKVSARYGIIVSEKAVAQAMPIIGAAGGAAINLLFTDHFQQIAKGHFTIRRLERIYGSEYVQREYVKMKKEFASG